MQQVARLRGVPQIALAGGLTVLLSVLLTWIFPPLYLFTPLLGFALFYALHRPQRAVPANRGPDDRGRLLGWHWARFGATRVWSRRYVWTPEPSPSDWSVEPTPNGFEARLPRIHPPLPSSNAALWNVLLHSAVYTTLLTLCGIATVGFVVNDFGSPHPDPWLPVFALYIIAALLIGGALSFANLLMWSLIPVAIGAVGNFVLRYQSGLPIRRVGNVVGQAGKRFVLGMDGQTIEVDHDAFGSVLVLENDTQRMVIRGSAPHLLALKVELDKVAVHGSAEDVPEALGRLQQRESVKV